MGSTRFGRSHSFLNRGIAVIYARTQRSVHYDSMSHKTICATDSIPCYIVLIALTARLVNARGVL